MNTATRKLLCILTKDFSNLHTASSLAQQLQMSRWGVWKIIKKLEKEEIIIL
ncbi:MAG: Lrp/AsnC family transcriptional regulator, partial [Nanoarchaeota archaeon]|nr:Lrp/AsnC family transcriptional regulator [Nanoarchaeota archaeon]